MKEHKEGDEVGVGNGEWVLDEQSRVDERAGLPMPTDDPERALSRLVAKGLAAPLDYQLPADFAKVVAAEALAGRVRREWDSPVIAVALGLILIPMFVYGFLLSGLSDFLDVLTKAISHGPSVPVMASVGVCVAISGMLKRVHMQARYYS